MGGIDKERCRVGSMQRNFLKAHRLIVSLLPLCATTDWSRAGRYTDNHPENPVIGNQIGRIVNSFYY